MLKGTVKTLLFLFLLGVLAVVSSYNYNLIKRELVREKAGYLLVEGNVNKPGYYKVNPIATNLDILKQAGLNDSSDITGIDLVSMANAKKSLEVGVSREKIKKKPSSFGFSSPNLVYFMGNVIIKRESKLRKAKIHQRLREGDIIGTKAGGKAKILFTNRGELDVSENTMLMLKSLGESESPAQTTVAVRSGKIRIQYPNPEQGATMMVVTNAAKIKLGGQSVEAVVKSDGIKSLIHVIHGSAEIVSVEGGASESISSGENVIVWRGKGKVEKTVKTVHDSRNKSGFNDLDNAYQDFIKCRQETSMLITSGGFNMVITMIPKKKRIVFMDLPPDTYVGEYLDGAFRLDQAVAFSGSETTREVVRRIIGRPVQYVMSIDYHSAYNFAYSLDGLMLEVDGGAAFAMRISPGLQRLSRGKILEFLNPGLPGGSNMAVKRQKMVFMAFLKQIKNRGSTGYMAFIQDVVARSSTNLSKKDAIKFFKTYLKIDNWSLVNVRMPSENIAFGPVNLVKPEYKRIREIYN